MTSTPKDLRPRTLRAGWWIVGGLAATAAVYLAQRNGAQPPTVNAPSGEPSAQQLPPTSPSAVIDLPVKVFNPTLSVLRLDATGKVVLALGSEGTIMRSTDDGRTWETIPTGTREYLFDAATHAATNSTIVVGSRGTVLRSDDAGASFSKISLPTDLGFRAIACSDTDGRILVVGDDGVAFTSMDGGQTFVSEKGATSRYLSKVLAVPGKNRFVLSGEEGVILVRDAAGRYLRAKTPAKMLVTALANTPDGSIIAGTQDGYVLHSSDAGETFVEAYKMPEDTFAIGFDSNDSGTTLLGRIRDRTILLSRDQGRSFVPLAFEPKQGVGKMAWIERTGFLGLGLQGAVITSDPLAKIWRLRHESALSGAHALLMNPHTKTVYAVGASGLIARSTNLGRRFELVQPSFGGILRAMAWDFTRACVVATGFDATILRSGDDGLSFSRVPAPVDAKTEIGSVVFEPRSKAFVAGTSEGVLLRSTNCGQSWSRVRGAAQAVLGLLSVGNGSLLATAKESAILRSADGGEHFVPTTMDSDATLRRITVAGDGQSIVAVGDGGRIYRTVDGGQSWERIPSGESRHLRALDYDSTTKVLWAAGDGGLLLRSTTHGLSWELVASGTDENLFSIGIDSERAALFVGGNAGTVLRSVDGGQRFVRLHTGSTQTIRVIAFDPSAREFIVAGSGGTLLRTLEGNRLMKVAGNYDGRMDVACYHPPSHATFIGGDRLYRLGGK